MFFDEAKIYVRAGRGGNGCVAFRREKGVPFGGPAGGNGGKGGDVYVRASGHMNTLVAFQKQSHFAAEDGQNGRGKDQVGRRGQDVVVDVPQGTVVRDADTGHVLADLVEVDQRVCVARGGRAGRGNAAFATSTNQAPRLSERGEPGEERWLALELKLIADVGLVGMPNAGKSTLLAAVSAANPKIAGYPFTTIQPNLGVVTLGYATSFVLADLPGLIEGASRGVGLGYTFLRHVERTRLLVHLIDGASMDPLGNFDAINRELEAFSAALAAKPQIVAVTKLDLPEVRELWPVIEEALAARGIDPYVISAVTGEGVRELLGAIASRLAELPEELPREEVDIVPEVDEHAFTIATSPLGWHVRGVAIERAAKMTNWDQEESLARFQRILQAMGITMALREAGVAMGDTVYVGETELQWGWEPV
ncbi:MAG: GTPase ObgE [Anaerolineae bacterium]|nr:GTPase ObgE [Anaerolineae bacterium]